MILQDSTKTFTISMLIIVSFFTADIVIVYAAETQNSATSAGGGKSNSTSYSADTTIGDTVAGTSNSSSYIYHAGFLPIFDSGTVPDAPTSLGVTSGDSQVSLSWTAPADDGGSSITDYIVEYSSDNGVNWTTFDDGTSTGTTVTVTNLENDQEYQFRVSAVNSVGTGNPSDTSTATPATATPPIITPTPTTSTPSDGDGGDSPGSDSNKFGGGGLNFSNLKIYEISWNLCDSNIMRVLAGPASIDLDVKLRTTQKVIIMQLAEDQPYNDVFFFEANISPSETFVLVQAETVYTRDVYTSKQSVIIDVCSGQIIVNEYTPDESTPDSSISPPIEYGSEPLPEPELLIPAPFVDPTKDPQYYLDRYNNEPAYKEWFDTNYSQYDSIYHALGLDESKYVAESKPEELTCGTNQVLIGDECIPVESVPPLAPYVDDDHEYFIDLYENDPKFREWFEKNYPNHTIYTALGIEEESDSELNYVSVIIIVIIILSTFVVYWKIKLRRNTRTKIGNISWE